MSSLFQDWPVFRAISQLFILVPSLLGLKGNLDMCLASRLSTQANLGNMHELREIVKMIVGNIALVQIQAIVAAVLVSIFAVVVDAIAEGSAYTFKWNNCLLLATASVCTATSSCFILGKNYRMQIKFPLYDIYIFQTCKHINSCDSYQSTHRATLNNY